MPDAVKAQRPESHLGVSVLPLLPYYRQLAGSYMTHSARPRADRPWFDAVPEDKAIELITFRNGFEPDAQYLALQGFHGRRYSSIDANATACWSSTTLHNDLRNGFQKGLRLNGKWMVHDTPRTVHPRKQ